ncbi:MAG: hypothetical protein ACFB9N_08605 [Geitlerinemataceae cyanobacterium]
MPTASVPAPEKRCATTAIPADRATDRQTGKHHTEAESFTRLEAQQALVMA